jgi:predicted kinase
MVTSKHKPILHVLCGKLASGKTTLAKRIAEDAGAVLFSEDLWLSKLFPGEIVHFSDYLSRSARFRAAIEPYVRTLLDRGISIVFDFAGNVQTERAWARSLCDAQKAPWYFIILRLPTSYARAVCDGVMTNALKVRK